MSGQWFVRQPGEGRGIDLGNVAMTVKAASNETNGAFTLLKAAEPPNFGPPMHIHRNAGFRVGQMPSRKLNVYVPEAMVGYFDELAGAIAAGEVSAEHLGSIAERYGVEVLGPVPEVYA